VERVWADACRENDIPKVGDWLVYDISATSRDRGPSGFEEIRAYPNVCHHRATASSMYGLLQAIQCSYHADLGLGRFDPVDSLPVDFPGPDDQVRLREVPAARPERVGVREPRPQGRLAGELPGRRPHLAVERWPWRRAWKAVHVGKISAVQLETRAPVLDRRVLPPHHEHPQPPPLRGDVTASTMSTAARPVHQPVGVASPYLGDRSEQEVVDAMLGDVFTNLCGEKMTGFRPAAARTGQTARTCCRTSCGCHSG